MVTVGLLENCLGLSVRVFLVFGDHKSVDFGGLWRVIRRGGRFGGRMMREEDDAR